MKPLKALSARKNENGMEEGRWDLLVGLRSKARCLALLGTEVALLSHFPSNVTPFSSSTIRLFSSREQQPH